MSQVCLEGVSSWFTIFVETKILFMQRAASICGIVRVSVCVHDQSIFQQHRAALHDILQRSWTDSDITNRLLAKLYPIWI